MSPRTPNELQWFDLKIRFQENRPSNCHQGDVPKHGYELAKINLVQYSTAHIHIEVLSLIWNNPLNYCSNAMHKVVVTVTGVVHNYTTVDTMHIALYDTVFRKRNYFCSWKVPINMLSNTAWKKVMIIIKYFFLTSSVIKVTRDNVLSNYSVNSNL